MRSEDRRKLPPNHRDHLPAAFRPRRSVPPGLHLAALTEIESDRQGWLVFRWTLDYRLDSRQPGEGIRKAEVFRRYGHGTSERKGALHFALEGWLARELTAEEFRDFDFNELVGKDCLLLIIYRTSRGGKRFLSVETPLPASVHEDELHRFERVVKRQAEFAVERRQ